MLFRSAVSQDAARTDRHRSRSFFIGWQGIKKHTFSGCAFFRISPRRLSFDDSLARANASAGTAVDALIGIDDIDIAGRDRFGRALADAGAAGNAGISDFVSHCVKNLLLRCVLCPANIGTYLIISKPV